MAKASARKTRAKPAARNAHRYERMRDPLAARSVFYHRLWANLQLALAIVVGSLAVGTIGYYVLGNPDTGWLDAFLNAAMILSGMGPVDKFEAPAAKVFSGLYALYSGFALLATAGVILAPILHRFLHRFHLEDEEDEK
jgi:hypothetical protein